MTDFNSAVAFRQAVSRLRAMLSSVEFDIEHVEDATSPHAYRLLGERNGYTAALQVCAQEERTLRGDFWKPVQVLLAVDERRLVAWPASIWSSPISWYSDHFTAIECQVFVTSERVIFMGQDGTQYEVIQLEAIHSIHTQSPYGRVVLCFDEDDSQRQDGLRFDLMPWTGEPERFIAALHGAWRQVRSA